MMRQENLRLMHERDQMVEKIGDNTTKIKQNKVLPYLVSNVVEVCNKALPWKILTNLDS
jgi:26S proteasome regulatory subunit T5